MIAVSDQESSGPLTWQILAAPAEPGTHQPPGSLATQLQFLAPGNRITGGFGYFADPLPPGRQVQHMTGRAPDGTEFVVARFTPGIATLHLETTRGTIAIDVTDRPTHFGLRFWAGPIPGDREFLTAYGDPTDYVPLSA